MRAHRDSTATPRGTMRICGVQEMHVTSGQVVFLMEGIRIKLPAGETSALTDCI